MTENTGRRKRYYKTGELVWIKPLKTEGKVVEIIIPELSVRVSIKTEDGLETRKYLLQEIDKLRSEKNNRKRNKVDTILFAKVRDKAIIPTKNDEDGGYDVYACLPDIGEIINPVGQVIGNTVVIKSGEVVLIPTGIASSLLPKYRFVGKERGSTGTKAMAVRAGVIDSGYRGEWFVAINNTGNKDIVISNIFSKVNEYNDRIEYPANKAIAQVNLQIVPKVNQKEITYEQLQKIPSQRGSGALGNSGK